MTKNSNVTLQITDMTPDGNGIGRTDGGMVVFVPGAVTGDSIRAKIIKAGKSFCVGRLEELLSPSGNRVEPDCPHHGRCGGCTFPSLSRTAELEFKKKLVNDALERIGALTLRCDEIVYGDAEHYRNKAVYPVSADADGELFTGFFARRSHRVVRQDVCLLENAAFSDIRAYAVGCLTKLGVTAYDESTGRGMLRHIFMRSSRAGDICLMLIMTSDSFAAAGRRFAESLSKRFPAVKSVWLNVNSARTNVILGPKTLLLYGERTLTDTLCGKSFDIGPTAFYQVNPEIAEKLYLKAAEYAQVKPGDILLDLYCGAGTIGICAAADGCRLTGVETVAEAVENASANARRNGRSDGDTLFVCGDASLGAKECAKRFGTPDTVFADPPRKGLSPEVIEPISESSAHRLVYVSCNPATLARDLAVLEKRGFSALRCCAFDMFPRTGHVETVVLLSKGKIG